MSIRELNLKPVYYSDQDNLLTNFYLPVLSNSIKYDRIAGYFCSNALAIATKGISNFISNGGRIRLIANVVLSTANQEAIREALLRKELASNKNCRSKKWGLNIRKWVSLKI